MRYYEEKYPEVDDLVMVTVKQIAEMGAYVKLVSSTGISIYSSASFRLLLE
jgi:translation initiation factor 2 subunit 1